ncbi:MAG: DUF5698 domain-containing protein [Chloroflexota bacterium]|nr:DUF5698 domain-containing protein [Chloroflexota bacterium]
MNIFLEALLIFTLRVVGISISTLSTLMTVRGRKLFAVLSSSFSALVYIIALGKVVTNLDNIANIAAYCCGVAAGTWIGMLLEQRLALGFAEVRFISPDKSDALAEALRLLGFGVTELYGHGRESVVGIVETIVPRKDVDQVLDIAKAVDETAIVTVREARTVQRGYWRTRRRR